MKCLFPSCCLLCDEPLWNLCDQDYSVCRVCWLTYASLRLRERSGCPICGRPLLGKIEFCQTCSRSSWSFQSIHSLFEYSSLGGDLVRRYKFEPLPRLSAFFAQFFLGLIEQGSILVPTPALPRHQRQRGWDPVSALGKEICRLTQSRWVPCLKRRDSLSQKTLSRQKRQENAKKAFALKRKIFFDSVWLIDDVVTTGATIEACSRLLTESGVKNVKILCLSLH